VLSKNVLPGTDSNRSKCDGFSLFNLYDIITFNYGDGIHLCIILEVSVSQSLRERKLKYSSRLSQRKSNGRSKRYLGWCNILVEGSQASPVYPNKGSVKVKTLFTG
jgi:hypothetical protein